MAKKKQVAIVDKVKKGYLAEVRWLRDPKNRYSLHDGHMLNRMSDYDYFNTWEANLGK